MRITKNSITFITATVLVGGLSIGVASANAEPISPSAHSPQVASAISNTDKAELLASDGKLVGVFGENLPYSNSEYSEYVESAGEAPNVINFFSKWDESFRADGAETARERGAIPMITWESWVTGSAKNDPAYSLANIVAGGYDDYIRQYAKDVASYDKLIMLRLNHEMNGDWYPWGAGVNGNTAEQYRNVWTHIHDIFAEEGATNVAWVWSVNIIRSIPDEKVSLEELYPGDEYVDYIGVDGYSIDASSVSEVYQPTLDVIRGFSDRSVLLSEVGAKASSGKTEFISELFDFVADDAAIAGFVWFQATKAEGGKANWIFDDTAENTSAYKNGLDKLKLFEG